MLSILKNIREKKQGIGINVLAFLIIFFPTVTQADVFDTAALWLKADEITELDDGDLVPSWLDSSINDLNATQGDDSKQPTYQTNEVLLKPIVRFDGNDVLLTASTGGSSTITIFSVVKSANTIGGYFLGLGNNNKAIIHGYVGATWEYYSSPRTHLGDISTSEFQIITSRVGSSQTNPISLGADMGSIAPWGGGDVAELMIFKSALSNEDYNAVYDYLDAKYFESTVPDEPINLIAFPSFEEISLSWTVPASDGGTAITDYVAEYKLSSSEAWLVFDDGVSSNTTTTVTGLTDGESYDFRVSATNSEGTGAVSNTITSTSEHSVPSAPINLNASRGSHQISLSWTVPASDGGAEITNYAIEYKLSSSGTWLVFDDGISSNTTATVTELTDGESYDFRVSAINTEGTGIVSSLITAIPITTLLQDDFTGTIINLSKWIEVDPGGLGGSSGDVRQDDILITEDSDAGGTGTGSSSLVSIESFAANELEISATISGSGQALLGYGDRIWSDVGNHAYLVYKANNSSLLALVWSNGSLVNNNPCGTPTDGATYKMKIISTGLEVYKNDALSCTVTPNAEDLVDNKPVFLQSNGAITNFDDLQVIGIGNDNEVPSVPINLIASPSPEEIGLSWTTPVSDGGATITDYITEYKLSSSGTWLVFDDGISSTTVAAVTGLTNGESYDFRVSAINVEGPGAVSNTVMATPNSSVPSAPINLIAFPSPEEIDFSWTTPVSDGGATITDYITEYKLSSSGTWLVFDDGVSSNTTATVTGLINEESYDFRVLAINVEGTGAVSNTITATPHDAVPSVPTNLNASPGSRQIDLSWTVPVSEGGTAIIDYVTEYKLSSSETWLVFDDGISSNTTATVTELTDGESYDFRVSATNQGGTGIVSSTVAAIPITIFLQDDFTGTTIDQSKWTEVDPEGMGGTSGKVQQDEVLMVEDSDASATGEGTFSLISIDSFLVDGLEISATISGEGKALLGYGDSVWSGSGNYAYLIYVSGSTLMGLTWHDGAYSNSNTTCGTYTDGATYKMKIISTGFEVYKNDVLNCTVTPGVGNLVSNKPVFLQSNGVVTDFDDLQVIGNYFPPTKPDAPAIGVATEDNAEASVTFVAGFSGGSPVTSYTVTSSPGNITASGNISPIVVTGLTNGTEYSFTVTATNIIGISDASSASNAVTPDVPTVPDQVEGVSVSSVNKQVLLAWNRPDNGGSVITDYLVEYKPSAIGSWTTFTDGISLELKAIVSGLSNDTEYSFRISAINSGGPGMASVPIAATPVAISELIIVINGESNAGGQANNSEATAEELAPVSEVQMLNNTSFVFEDLDIGTNNNIDHCCWLHSASDHGFELQLATSVKAHSFPDNPQIHLIKTGQGGSRLAQWNVGGNYWNKFLERTAAAKTQLSTNKQWVVWLSIGINDYIAGTSELTFKTELIEHINNIKSDLPGTIVILTQFQSMSAHSGYPTYNTIMDEVAASEANVYVVDSSGADLDDGNHWSYTGLKTVTERMVTITKNKLGLIYPGVPINLIASPSLEEIDLSWTIPVGNGGTAITDYVTEYKLSSSETWLVFDDGISSNTTATVTGLTGEQEYDFRVSAVNSEGTGAVSSVTNATPTFSVPGVPINLIASSSHEEIDLSWTIPVSNGGTAITDYVTEYKLSSSETWLVFDDGISSNTTATVTGLTGEQEYDFRVSAVNSEGTGAVSSVTNATPTFSVPGVPTELEAIPSKDQVSLSWTAPISDGGTVITDYFIEYKTSAENNWTTFIDGVSTAVSTIITSLLDSTDYNFRVSAINDIGNGNIVTIDASTTDGTAPIISNIEATSADTTVIITWTTNEESSSRIEYGITDAYETLTEEIDIAPRILDHSVSLSDLTPCVIYNYQVISIDANTNSVISANNSFTTTGCTGSSVVVLQESDNIPLATGASIDLLEAGKGISLNIPALYTVGVDANFQIKQFNKGAVLLETATPSGHTSVGDFIYNLKALDGINSVVSAFDKPITVTLTYDDGDISGIDESSLKIHRWNGAEWNQLSDCVVNMLAKSVTCTTTSFSDFGLFGRVIVAPAPSYSGSGGGGGGGGGSGGEVIRRIYNDSNKRHKIFKVIINENVEQTNNSIVELGFEVGETIETVAISNTNNFTNATTKPYASSMKWDLCAEFQNEEDSDCPEGKRIVYVKFLGLRGQSKGIFLDSILYDKNSVIPGRLHASAPKKRVQDNLELGAIIDSSEETVRDLELEINERQTVSGLVSERVFQRNLKHGDVGNDVQSLQKLLNKDAVVLAHEGPGSPKNETKYFGPLTKNAVVRFQNKYVDEILSVIGLKNGTGYFGPSSRRFVNTFSNASIVENLEYGTWHNDIKELQQKLASDPEIYPDGIVSGFFGQKTKKAIQNFQLKHDVVKSDASRGYGNVGSRTKAKLKEIFGKLGYN